jgi:hypothetical protein
MAKRRAEANPRELQILGMLDLHDRVKTLEKQMRLCLAILSKSPLQRESNGQKVANAAAEYFPRRPIQCELFIKE